MQYDYTVYLYMQFKDYSRIAKTEVCHIYNLKHIKHNKFANVDSQFSNVWAYYLPSTNSTFNDGATLY